MMDYTRSSLVMIVLSTIMIVVCPIVSTAQEAARRQDTVAVGNSACGGSQLCLNHNKRRDGNEARDIDNRRIFGVTAGVAGKYLVQALVSAVAKKGLDEVIGANPGETDKTFDDWEPGPLAESADAKEVCLPEAEKESDKSICTEDLYGITFCNDVIHHPVNCGVKLQMNNRDTGARKLFEDLIASENSNSDVTMKELVEGSSDVCKAVLKQSICLAAFPPCACTYKTACKNACELMNKCAEEAGLDTLCENCLNYCDESCSKCRDTMKKGKGFSTWEIVGIVVGSVVGLCCLGAMCVLAILYYIKWNL